MTPVASTILVIHMFCDVYTFVHRKTCFFGGVVLVLRYTQVNEDGFATIKIMEGLNDSLLCFGGFTIHSSICFGGPHCET